MVTRAVLAALLLAACSPAETAAFQRELSNTGNALPAPSNQPQRCFDKSQCTDPNAVCLIPQGQTEGTCAVPR